MISDIENEPCRAFVLTFMLARWPNLVVERLDNNREWFVHRSIFSKELVDDWGRTNDNLENFVHVVFADGNAEIEQTCLTALRLKQSFIAWYNERNPCRVAPSI